MNEQVPGLSTEMMIAAVVAIVAIFYFGYRFVRRAGKVNKKVRRVEELSDGKSREASR